MPGRGATFEVVEHVGREPGPTVSLLGGVHGDEEEGVLAVQRVGAALRDVPLARGMVRAVAVAHPAAYAANTRTSPLDGLNLARCFPGKPLGSPTERLAYELTERVIRGSDRLIDLHSAGRRYAMPTFVGYTRSDDAAEASARAMAAAFGAPLIWEHPAPPAPGRTVSAAFALGIPSIYVEGSGGGSLEQAELDVYVDGVLSVLAALGMTAPQTVRRRPLRIIPGGSGDLDGGIAAPAGGRFVARSAAGAVLTAGEPIGDLVDEDGATISTIVCPRDATLVFVRRAARIQAGEVVCSLAPPSVPWEDE
jgi:predicted deacylase